MDDEKGLDLSLSLRGGSNTSQKGNRGSASENRSDEGDRDTKLINEFKNFLEGGTQQHPPKVEENIYSNFGKAVVDAETSKNSNTGGMWNNDSRSAETEEERRSSVGEKRKGLFPDANQQKKLEREGSNLDLVEKTKVSHISITTDEGSTAENEDVADSEVDGSTSRHASQTDDMTKRFVSSGSISRIQKDGFGDSSGVEILGQKRYAISSEKEIINRGNMPSYGVPYPGQPVNTNMPYTSPGNNSNSIGAPNLPSYPMPGILHGMTAPNGERPAAMQSNFPLMFGYNPVQLPALDRDNSRGATSHHLPVHPAYIGRNPPEALNDNRKLSEGPMPMMSHKSPQSTQFDGRTIEHGKNNGKQQIGEEGSSSHRESDLRGTLQVRDTPDQPQPRAETPPSEYPSIRPGIAADLKFGGCGSYPNLPWVSTTGSGPHGRTISGVTYRYSATQIRIVCACHGSHLSPEEFVRHASEESSTPGTGAGLASVSGNNPSASAHS
ncbi:ninja-family protein mc410 [Andrographis paniculata]|uniref:ninja-family protein mc410 n=1 Tax=Andrographis paniculata TaxID=175694 RepID=UPI0021E8CDAD|nr:ninja-family protein mc410 [Andrographis paniculata]